MLYDLEQTLGRDVMDKLLRELVSTYEYGVVRPQDVRAMAASVSGKDLSAFWARWRNTGD
jgi:aminopeptidase N